MLPRPEIETGLPTELSSVAEFVRALSPAELAQPTRCAGWTVADVAAHLAGSLADVTAGRLEGAGSPEWTARQVAERQGRTGAELADELHGDAKAAGDLLRVFDDAAWTGPAPAGVAGTLADGVLSLWYDAWLHTDDMRAALRRPTVRGPGLVASVHHVADTLARNDWGAVSLSATGDQVRAETASGVTVAADPYAFVLAATGRLDPATLGLGPDVNLYKPA